MWLYFKIVYLFLVGRRHEARSLAVSKFQRLLKKYYAIREHDGVCVTDESWDYLIILDACRYDFFEKVYRQFLPGTLQKKISRATSTSEWLNKNFPGRYDDMVYVSGNPHCSDHEIYGFRGTDHFFKVEHVWRYAWSEEYDTVLPGEMVKAALRLRDMHPDKRMIIHLIQPHGPWVGKTKVSVAEIGKDPTLRSAIEGKWTADTLVWELVRQGRFSIELLKQADMDNLVLALEHVRTLVDELDGRIVVTADHGEAFGEKFVVGHPPGIYFKELVEVPWLVIDKGKREHREAVEKRELSKDAVPALDSSKDEILIKRLRTLGYME